MPKETGHSPWSWDVTLDQQLSRLFAEFVGRLRRHGTAVDRVEVTARRQHIRPPARRRAGGPGGNEPAREALQQALNLGGPGFDDGGLQAGFRSRRERLGCAASRLDKSSRRRRVWPRGVRCARRCRPRTPWGVSHVGEDRRFRPVQGSDITQSRGSKFEAKSPSGLPAFSPTRGEGRVAAARPLGQTPNAGSAPPPCGEGLGRGFLKLDVTRNRSLQAGIPTFALAARYTRQRHDEIGQQPPLGCLPEDMQPVSDLHFLEVAEIGVELFQRRLVSLALGNPGILFEPMSAISSRICFFKRTSRRGSPPEAS